MISNRTISLFCLMIFFFLFDGHFLIGLPVFPANAREDSKAFTDTDIDTYKQFLEKFDKYEKESILFAKDELLKKFSKSSRHSDEAFRLFRRLYGEVIANISEAFRSRRDYSDLLFEISEVVKNGYKNPLSAFQKLDNKPSKEIRERYTKTLKELYAYRDCGIGFGMAEGDWYLEEDVDFLVKISSFLKGELREYIIFYAKENREIIAEDAGLFITWDELRKKIIRYEDFSRNHPNLPEVENEVRPELKKMFHWYLAGTDNTCAYDTGSGQLEPELKMSYEKFLKENKNSEYYNIIKGVYMILKKYNFQINRELVTFLNNHGYKCFLRVEVERFQKSVNKGKR